MSERFLTLDQAFGEAVVHHQAGRLTDAEQVYRAILNHHPKHADTNHNLGVLALQMDRYEQSLNFFKAAWEIDPGRVEFNIAYAEALLRSGEVARADELLAQAHREGLAGPDIAALTERVLAAKANPVAYAVECIKTGRKPEALAVLGRYVETRPNDGRALAQYGELLRHQQGREAEAVEVLERATRWFPKNYMPWLSLGTARRQLNRLEEAKDAFLKALSFNPNSVEAANDLAVIYIEEGNWAEANALLEKAVALVGTAPAMLLNFARCLAKTGRVDDAERVARKALALGPPSSDGILMFLAGLGRAEVPQTLSDVFIKDLYSQRAANWDQGSADGVMGYRGHLLVAEAFLSLYSDKADILDAGCGTGLVGERVAGRASRLDGVDLSMEMLRIALGKKIYSALNCCDLVEFMKVHAGTYDAVLSAATVIHFRDLDLFFQAAFQSLKERGLFIFTAFPAPGDKEIAVMPDGLGLGGCFLHGHNYLNDLANRSGFRVLRMSEEIHEFEGDSPRHALLVVLAKGGGLQIKTS